MPDQRGNHLGHLVGEYRLVRKLGGGGFGTVYLAEHVYEQTQAAVKLLQIPLTESEDFKDFINEARTIRLRHPHIMPLLDFGISRNDLPYLVMEIVSCSTISLHLMSLYPLRAHPQRTRQRRMLLMFSYR